METIADIINSEKFSSIFVFKINKLRNKLQDGNRYKRNAAIYLLEQDKFEPKYLVDEYSRIVNGTSKLPTRVRLFINDLFMECMKETCQLPTVETRGLE